MLIDHGHEFDLDAIQLMASRGHTVDEAGREEGASPGEVMALVARARRHKVVTSNLKQLCAARAVFPSLDVDSRSAPIPVSVVAVSHARGILER